MLFLMCFFNSNLLLRPLSHLVQSHKRNGLYAATHHFFACKSYGTTISLLLQPKQPQLNILSLPKQPQLNILSQPNQPQLDILSQSNQPQLDIFSQPNQPQLNILSQPNQPQHDILSQPKIRILPPPDKDFDKQRNGWDISPLCGIFVSMFQNEYPNIHLLNRLF